MNNIWVLKPPRKTMQPSIRKWFDFHRVKSQIKFLLKYYRVWSRTKQYEDRELYRYKQATVKHPYAPSIVRWNRPDINMEAYEDIISFLEKALSSEDSPNYP